MPSLGSILCVTDLEKASQRSNVEQARREPRGQAAFSTWLVRLFAVSPLCNGTTRQRACETVARIMRVKRMTGCRTSQRFKRRQCIDSAEDASDP